MGIALGIVSIIAAIVLAIAIIQHILLRRMLQLYSEGKLEDVLGSPIEAIVAAGEKIYEDITLVTNVIPESDAYGLAWDFSHADKGIIGVTVLETGTAKEIIKQYRPEVYDALMEKYEEADFEDVWEELLPPTTYKHCDIIKVSIDGEEMFTWEEHGG